MTALAQPGHQLPVAVTSKFLVPGRIEWLVFGDQLDRENFRTRPQPAGRGYVSIFAGGAPGDRVEWPVFGEQIDDLTAATRPTAAGHEGISNAVVRNGFARLGESAFASGILKLLY